MPENIGELIALLAADPDAFGEKGSDLLDKLVEVQEEGDSEKAAKLIEEIDKWVAEGQLDPNAGALAQQLLAPLAAQPSEDGRGPRDGGPPGQEDD